MSNDADRQETRVFVSGLPPKFTSEQLNAHFAGRFQVTDAVVIPGRRIGFVGFTNPSLAGNAIKYFDKSYIRMSKISVRISKPFDLHSKHPQGQGQSSPQITGGSAKQGYSSHHLGISETTQIPSHSSYASNSNNIDSKKRKRESADIENEETDKYVHLVQLKKSKPIRMDENKTSLESPSGKENSAEDNKRDGSEAENVRKKRPGKIEEFSKTYLNQSVADGLLYQSNQPLDKWRNHPKAKEATPEHQGGTNPGIDGTTVHAGRSDGPGKRTEKDKMLKFSQNAGADDAPDINCGDIVSIQPKEVTSDVDWIRAKTNRALDLVDKIDDPTERARHEARNASSKPENQSDAIFEARASATTADISAGSNERFSNGRLFVRNLPFSSSESEIEELFSQFGKLHEVHVVHDAKKSTGRGLAYVQYVEPTSAIRAFEELDCSPFQGRLLHILPALEKKMQVIDEFEISKLPLKKQKALRRKREAVNSTFSWNSLYMNPDAVMSSVAARLGVNKADLLDPTSSDSAVKQAHAETHVIQETKSYLASNGVNLDSFRRPGRDDTSLLVKNFAFGMTAEDLRSLFEPFGRITKILLPPSGTIAIIQYNQAHEAAKALKHLAYKNLHGSILFVEKGPQGLFDGIVFPLEDARHAINSRTVDEGLASKGNGSEVHSSTIFVRSLNFSTTSERLKKTFEPLDGFLSARVKTKVDPTRPGEVLSMGFGFVDFRTQDQARAAIEAMDGYKLDGHEILLRVSQKNADAAEERRRDDNARKVESRSTKIVIKNLPFEATKKDVRSIFGAYGQLRSVRVPKKFDNSPRGFAFAEFVNAKEAENAIEALANTHLLGRRLVLEFTTSDMADPEEEIRATEKRVGQQAEKLHLRNITGSSRRKFVVGVEEDAE